MDKVQNKNDIQEIAEYLMSTNVDTQHIVNNNIQPNHQNDKINTLISMGYKMNSVKKALEISNNDLQIAAQYLIDGLINVNQPKPKPKLKGIEFDDVNDTNNIHIGALMQIVSTNHKKTIHDYWNEANISSSYNDSLRGLVGIIKSIYSNNQTIKIQTKDEKEHIVPIKACFAIKYQTLTDKKDKLLVCGYTHNVLCDGESINIPPLINKICYEYYHIVRLRLTCEDCKENDILITKDSCKLSGYLDAINTLCNGKISSLHIKNVKYDTLKLISEWLTHHKGIEPEPIPKPITSVIMKQMVDIWDANYVDGMTKKEIFEVILASNHLNIYALMNLASAKIATLIKGKSPEEIRQILNQ
eukprot:310655_1